MKKPTLIYQFLAVFTALLAMTTGGLHYGWPSPSLPQYIDGNSTSFRLTNDEGSLVIVMLVIAPIIFCFVAAAIVDKIGRKKAILLTAIPYFISWVMIVFANSAAELAIARFLAGVSDGIGFTVIPIYIAEIADPNIRGLFGASISSFWIFGILIINVIGVYLSITTTAAICCAGPVLLLVTFMWMPESPYFLLMKKEEEKARAVLIKLRGRSDVEEELTRLKESINLNQERGSILELFTKRNNQKGLAVVLIIRNSQQMSGAAAISFYTLTIFQEAGDFMSPIAATITYVAIQWIMTAVCSAIIDKAGRRPLLILSLIGSGISLFVEGTYFYIKDFTNIDTNSFNFVPVVALICYVVTFHIGAQPIPLLMQAELFPTNVKAFASSVSEVYFCILVSVFSKIFQVTRDNYGIYLPFYLFAVCSFVNLIFVVLFVPETKGKNLQEIQDILCGRNKVTEGVEYAEKKLSSNK